MPQTRFHSCCSLFLLFNHQFTPEQDADARASLGVNRVVKLPEDLQAIWAAIPPDAADIAPYLAPIKAWLAHEAQPDDYALIQGDFGATYLMVRFAFEHGLRPVYATSRREAQEIHQPDGSITLVHHFRHRRFRLYGR